MSVLFTHSTSQMSAIFLVMICTFLTLLTVILIVLLCRWYRGKVTGVEDGGFRVYFFDYGDKEVVNRSDVKPLPEEYAKLPGQAVPCRLDGIKPIGKMARSFMGCTHRAISRSSHDWCNKGYGMC